MSRFLVKSENIKKRKKLQLILIKRVSLLYFSIILYKKIISFSDLQQKNTQNKQDLRKKKTLFYDSKTKIKQRLLNEGDS